MKTIHRHGGKILLSFGGATSSFNITDVAQFETNLAAYFKSHPGYDGVDFDDENINAGTAQLLTEVITATRTKFPALIISFDAFMSGVDPSNPFEAGVLENAGPALSYVNVMDYDQYGWKPTDHPNCHFQTGYSDDCYLDVIEDFANVAMPSGGTFGSAKVVMGLMIGPADDGAIITPGDAQSYAQYVKSNAYGGVMIWDVDRDGPQATGHPKGTYISAIGGALGI
jgi:GH18 family chitinase